MFRRRHGFPAPLAVAFHKWEDQSCPQLLFSCFVSIKWDKTVVKNSDAWSDPLVSSVLMAGTECGVVAAYRIRSSNGKLLNVEPLALIFGHNCSITSLVECEPMIYNASVACLSFDGTVSLISVEDLTIVLNQTCLFSENSRDLAAHETDPRLMLAVQAYGTVEVADIYDGSLIMKISGFSSILTSITSHRGNHSVSCVDGTISVFCVNDSSAECLYSIRNPVEKEHVLAIMSPDMSFILVMSPSKWWLYDSDEPFFEGVIKNKADYFVKARWVTNTKFYVYSLSGRIEVWEMNKANNADIMSRVELHKDRYYVSGIYEKRIIESHMVGAPKVKPEKSDCVPELSFAVEYASVGFDSPVAVTVEGFVVTSPSRSFLLFKGPETDLSCSLMPYFKQTYNGRCAIGDPIRHEARIGAEGEIFVDDFSKPIGFHSQAFRLFSPPGDGNCFFTFSKNGSIFQWDCDNDVTNKKVAEYYDLNDVVYKTVWIEETHWLVCIGELDSFSVIDPKSATSILLCSGHNSHIVDVSYRDGLLHARCESSSVYTWNLDGQLVSRVKSKVTRRIGQLLGMSKSVSSKSEPKLAQKALENPSFSRVVDISMPNCQTFAVVFDVLDFLDTCPNINLISKVEKGAFLPLILLLKCHLGESKAKVLKEMTSKILSSFSYAIAGDNYTVTLPISAESVVAPFSSSGKFPQMTRPRGFSHNPGLRSIASQMIHIPSQSQPLLVTSHLAFKLSSLLSATHAVAASTLSKCFAGLQNKVNSLAMMDEICEQETDRKLEHGVTPSILVLCEWLTNTNPNLRSVVINIIGKILAKLSEKDCQSTFKTIQQWFSKNYEVLLPVMLLVARHIAVPEAAARECCDNMFPYLVNSAGNVTLALQVFPKIVHHITDIRAFFIKLMESLSKHSITEEQLALFAVASPLEFLEVAMLMPRCPEYILLCIQHWDEPDRDILLHLIMNLLRAKQFDFTKPLTEISKRYSFVYACKQFVVVGCKDGRVAVISKESASIVWQIQVSGDPVTFVTMSPNGTRLLVLVISQSRLTWASATSSKSRDLFELIGTASYHHGIEPTTSVWKGETKVILSAGNEVLAELKSPK